MGLSRLVLLKHLDFRKRMWENHRAPQDARVQGLRFRAAAPDAGPQIAAAFTQKARTQTTLTVQPQNSGANSKAEASRVPLLQGHLPRPAP